MALRSLLKSIVFDRWLHRDRLYVLNYHHIVDDDCGNPDPNGCATSLPEFRSALDWLLGRFPVVGLHDWLLAPQSGPCVAITFDDGNADVVELAGPVLSAAGVSATLFLNTGYGAEKGRICWSDYGVSNEVEICVAGRSYRMEEAVSLARRTSDPGLYTSLTDEIERTLRRIGTAGRKYLSLDDAKRLDPGVFSVGLHGHLHHRYSMFGEDWQCTNSVLNLRALQALPSFVPLLAFPFGTSIDVDESAVRVCRDLNLLPVFHSGGYNVPRQGFALRIPADGRRPDDLVVGQSPFSFRHLPRALQ